MDTDPPETLTSSTSLPLNLGAWLTADPAQSEIGGPGRSDASARILQAADTMLLRGEGLLSTLGVAAYFRKVAGAPQVTIGVYYRACLQHFNSVVRAPNRAVVDYNDAAFEPRAETDPGHALELSRQLRRKLAEITPGELHRSVAACCPLGGPGSTAVTASTIGRELAHCIAHAMHCHALMAALARLPRTETPDDASAHSAKVTPCQTVVPR